MWDASVARSRMVTRCSGSGRPCGLRKVDQVIPIALACSFIRRTKPSSDPARPSAKTIVASLRIAVGADVSMPGRADMVAPCVVGPEASAARPSFCGCQGGLLTFLCGLWFGLHLNGRQPEAEREGKKG